MHATVANSWLLLQSLKDHELGVRVEEAEGGHGPHVPKDVEE
jgi:hypothetical protein